MIYYSYPLSLSHQVRFQYYYPSFYVPVSQVNNVLEALAIDISCTRVPLLRDTVQSLLD